MSEQPGRDDPGGPRLRAPQPPADPAAPGHPPGDPPPSPWAAPGGPPEPAGEPPLGSAATGGPARWQPAAATSSPDQGGQPVGGVPLRPLSFGEILGGATGILRRSPRTVVPLCLLLGTLQQVLVLAAQLLTREIPTRVDIASGSVALSLAGGLGAVLGLLLSATVGAVLTGMIVVLTADDMLGRRVGIGELWRRVRPRLAALIGVSLLAGVLSVLALFLLVLPGMLLWSAWALATPALLLERLGPIRALRRSWQLAIPDLLRVFAIRLVAFLLALSILYLIAAPFLIVGALLSDPGGAPADSQAPVVTLALAIVGSIIGGVIARPFGAAVLALLYLDRRMRAEGMDIALQLQLRQQRRGSPTAAGQPVRADLPALA